MSSAASTARPALHGRGAAAEVLRVFLRLGLTSFGGPVAHLGYFRAEFVERRGWLSNEAFAQLVALCQFLPGPASSQAGFAIGLLRGGALGGLAAWAGFTLPSAIALIVFAWASPGLAASSGGAAILHGLRLVAVAVVAQAVWGMARSLCPDKKRAALALFALALCCAWPGTGGQVAAIAACAAMALPLRLPSATSGSDAFASPVPARAGWACLAVFALLFLVPGGLFAAFYRSGALVFGGGHVVLPLLQDAVVTPGWVAPQQFLDGYGAAQAVPGPLFTFAAYLGFAARGLGGAIVALAGIFLPGLLLLCAALPAWAALARRPAAGTAIAGANAAVVGVLAAALYTPVWTAGVGGRLDFAVAAISFLLLTLWRVPVWAVVLADAAAGLAGA